MAFDLPGGLPADARDPRMARSTGSFNGDHTAYFRFDLAPTVAVDWQSHLARQASANPTEVRGAGDGSGWGDRTTGPIAFRGPHDGPPWMRPDEGDRPIVFAYSTSRHMPCEIYIDVASGRVWVVYSQV